jgi:predicted nuclease of restriction endonuclease-like (RecB) superfamily
MANGARVLWKIYPAICYHKTLPVKDFPSSQGFSSRNLWNMRNFYLAYKDNEKLQLLAAEIAWTHNVIIITKCKDNLELAYYMQMTQKFGWSKVILDHQIDNQSYVKFLTNQNNFDITLSEQYKNQAK